MPEDVYTHGRLLRLPEGKTVIGDDRGIAIASDPPSGSGGTIIVQEGGTDVDTATEKINFDASDFSTASSPAGTVSVGLAYGTSAGTPAEGNHTHSSTYAPIGAKYIVQQADANLTGEQAIGALATGILKNTTTTGVLSIATENTDYMSATAPASPLVQSATSNSAVTASTASTTTYAVNVTMDVALGAGTWTVMASGGGMFSHSSADGNVRVHIQVGSDAGTAIVSTAPLSATRGWIGCANTATGQTGTITVALEYRPNTTGTASAGGGYLTVIAVRTA